MPRSLRSAVSIAAAFGLPALILSELTPSTAHARFLETDADAIDRESRLLDENYNDRASYRPPVAWERIWAAGKFGWRASAGSLSINRFDYAEDIKASTTDPASPIALGYRQVRREDMIEDRLERELRVDWSPAGATSARGWRLAGLADGGRRKEFGDLGAAAAWVAEPGRREIEVYYWDPDLYFASKKEFAEDRIVQRTHTKGVRGSWRIFSTLSISGDVSHDWPLVWERVSRDYRYEYERRWYSWRVDLGAPPGIDQSDGGRSSGAGWSGYLRGQHERKREAKTWNEPTLARYRQSMQRVVDDVELGLVHSAGGRDRSIAVQGVRRHGDYAFVDYTGFGERDYAESPESGRWLRRDGGVYLTDHLPIGGTGTPHFFQLGLHANRDELNVDGPNYEIKLQTAYDARVGVHGGVFLNATWDLDQLGRDRRRLRPWGGGNIQFFIAF